MRNFKEKCEFAKLLLMERRLKKRLSKSVLIQKRTIEARDQEARKRRV